MKLPCTKRDGHYLWWLLYCKLKKTVKYFVSFCDGHLFWNLCCSLLLNTANNVQFQQQAGGCGSTWRFPASAFCARKQQKPSWQDGADGSIVHNSCSFLCFRDVKMMHVFETWTHFNYDLLVKLNHFHDCNSDRYYSLTPGFQTKMLQLLLRCCITEVKWETFLSSGQFSSHMCLYCSDATLE